MRVSSFCIYYFLITTIIYFCEIERGMDVVCVRLNCFDSMQSTVYCVQVLKVFQAPLETLGQLVRRVLLVRQVLQDQ